jgi:hypothetical protein
MTESQPPLTMKSGSKMGGKFLSGPLHPKWVDPALLLAKLKEGPFGSWVVIGNTIEKDAKSSYRYVLCRCSVTGVEGYVSVDNLVSGKSKGPHGKPRKYAFDPRVSVIGNRYDAIVQRCRNPSCEAYPAYGGRGIELRFSSRQHFITWVMGHLPHPSYKGVQLDRRDVNGHYEPGNLRLVTLQQNLQNKQGSVWVLYQGAEVYAPHLWHLLRTDHQEFSLGPARTERLLRMGVSIEEIIARPGRGKRPGSMTCSTPDPAIVSQYREK